MSQSEGDAAQFSQSHKVRSLSCCIPSTVSQDPQGTRGSGIFGNVPYGINPQHVSVIIPDCSKSLFSSVTKLVYFLDAKVDSRSIEMLF